MMNRDEARPLAFLVRDLARAAKAEGADPLQVVGAFVLARYCGVRSSAEAAALLGLSASTAKRRWKALRGSLARSALRTTERPSLAVPIAPAGSHEAATPGASTPGRAGSPAAVEHGGRPTAYLPGGPTVGPRGGPDAAPGAQTVDRIGSPSGPSTQGNSEGPFGALEGPGAEAEDRAQPWAPDEPRPAEDPIPRKAERTAAGFLYRQGALPEDVRKAMLVLRDEWKRRPTGWRDPAAVAVTVVRRWWESGGRGVEADPRAGTACPSCGGPSRDGLCSTPSCGRFLRKVVASSHNSR